MHIKCSKTLRIFYIFYFEAKSYNFTTFSLFILPADDIWLYTLGIC